MPWIYKHRITRPFNSNACFVLILPSETEEVKKEETTAVVKPKGKKPEFVLKIKTQTVRTLNKPVEHEFEIELQRYRCNHSPN